MTRGLLPFALSPYFCPSRMSGRGGHHVRRGSRFICISPPWRRMLRVPLYVVFQLSSEHYTTLTCLTSDYAGAGMWRVNHGVDCNARLLFIVSSNECTSCACLCGMFLSGTRGHLTLYTTGLHKYKSRYAYYSPFSNQSSQLLQQPHSPTLHITAIQLLNIMPPNSTFSQGYTCL